MNTYKQPLNLEEISILYRLTYLEIRYKFICKNIKNHPNWDVQEEQIASYQRIIRRSCFLQHRYLSVLWEKYQLPIDYVSRKVDFNEAAIIYTLREEEEKEKS